MIKTQDISNTGIFGNNLAAILRLDEIDPDVSGNKLYKLKYNLANAKAKQYGTIITFGGAFSNHIVAAAKTAHQQNMDSIGIIRGEEADLNNPTLSRAIAFGMKIIPVTREEYGERNDFDYIRFISNKYDAYVIPEGGSNYLGVNGTMDIWKDIDNHYDHIYVAAGTGTTAAGLILGAPDKSIVNAVSVLKGDFMSDAIEKQINWMLHDKHETRDLMKPHNILDNYHFGGYVKWTEGLLIFIEHFKTAYNIQLDPIYTGKMAFAASQEAQNYVKKRILLIHTGGLQGISGFEQRFDRKIS